MGNDLSNQLPDLEEIVCKAVPFEQKDCHLVRAMKVERREKLKVRIKEFAEIFHLMKLNDTPGIR